MSGERRVAMPSWRGLVNDLHWNAAPGVILLDMAGRRRTYEVYVNGQQVGRESRLNDARDAVESVLGPCVWERHRADGVKAEHYWFGPTEEFTDPMTFYTGTPE